MNALGFHVQPLCQSSTPIFSSPVITPSEFKKDVLGAKNSNYVPRHISKMVGIQTKLEMSQLEMMSTLAISWLRNKLANESCKITNKMF